jgi:hypothetical protein
MPLEFQINLGGNFVEALERNSKELSAAEKATKSFGDALERTEAQLAAIKADPAKFKKLADAQRELSKMSKELGGEEGSLKEKLEELTNVELGGFGFNLAEGLAGAFEKGLDALKEMAAAAYDLGKEIAHAAGDAEDLNLAIKLDVGTRAREDRRARRVVPRHALQPEARSRSRCSLSSRRAATSINEQWDDLVTAATDVATRRKTGSAGAKGALEALRGIEIQPQKIRGALKELGIKQKDFYDDLGDLLGISEHAAEKQVKAGKVKAQTLLSSRCTRSPSARAAPSATRRTRAARRSARRSSGSSNLKENAVRAPRRQPRHAGAAGLPRQLHHDDGGPIGTDLVNKLDSAFTELFGDVSGPDGLEKIRDVLSSGVSSSAR